MLWAATTADWGDVQPEHDGGVYLSEDTHYAIDIHDNAMFLIALDSLVELLPDRKKRRQPVHNQTAANCRKYLWNETNQKVIPHNIYLDGSCCPEYFDENQMLYHGETAVAIEAGLL